MPGFKDFINLTPLEELDLDDMLMKQTVMKFASVAARTAALTGKFRAGIVTILDDLRTIGVNTGATDVHSTIGPVYGALTTYTPTLVQSAAVTKTVTRGSFSRVGRRIECDFNLSVTSTGSASFPVLAGVPVAAFATAGATDVVGVGYVRDASANIKYRGLLVFIDTLQVQFLTLHSTTDGYLGNVDFTAALATGDQVSGTCRYEAAADA